VPFASVTKNLPRSFPDLSSNGILSIINDGEVSTRSNSATVLARSVLPDQSHLAPVNSDAADHTPIDFSTSTQAKTVLATVAARVRLLTLMVILNAAKASALYQLALVSERPLYTNPTNSQDCRSK